MNVHLLSVAGEFSPAFKHMLGHYRSLGISSIIVHTHGKSLEDPDLALITRAAQELGATIASTTAGRWSPAFNHACYSSSRLEQPDDWFVLADPDELQSYPEDLFSVLRYCDERGYDYIEGCFVDRIGANGHLSSLDAAPDIWSLFPLGAMITARICGGVINKIVAAKGRVRVGTGQHYAESGKGCPVSEVYVPVYHFKWSSDLVPKLRKRMAAGLNVVQPGYSVECARFLSHFDKHGRINIEDPLLLAGCCAPDYRHWGTVREMRIAARYFLR